MDLLAVLGITVPKSKLNACAKILAKLVNEEAEEEIKRLQEAYCNKAIEIITDARYDSGKTLFCDELNCQLSHTAFIHIIPIIHRISFIRITRIVHIIIRTH